MSLIPGRLARSPLSLYSKSAIETKALCLCVADACLPVASAVRGFTVLIPNGMKVIVGDKTNPYMCSGSHQIPYMNAPICEIM